MYLRLLADYVSLLAPKGQAKHAGILTYFQIKINEKRLKRHKLQGISHKTQDAKLKI